MKRWPVIRHIRALYLLWQVERWARTWGNVGIGLGVPNDSDMEHIRRIWKGQA